MLDSVILAGQVAGALTAIGALTAGALWFIRRIVHIVDAVDELKPNGGSSLKDQMTRVEARGLATHELLIEHIRNHHGEEVPDGQAVRAR